VEPPQPDHRPVELAGDRVVLPDDVLSGQHLLVLTDDALRQKNRRVFRGLMRIAPGLNAPGSDGDGYLVQSIAPAALDDPGEPRVVAAGKGVGNCLRAPPSFKEDRSRQSLKDLAALEAAPFSLAEQALGSPKPDRANRRGLDRQFQALDEATDLGGEVL